MITRHRKHRAWLAILSLQTLALPAHADFSALKKLESEGASVSAAVYDLDREQSLQTLKARQRLAPASVTKIAVAAAALDTWPADKTFQTRLITQGTIKRGRLDGDLLLQSEGDATLDQASLWLLAAQLKSAGVDSVDGGLLVNPAYGPLGCDNVDRCEALERSDTAYNVPLSAVGIDHGTWCTQVQTTTIGEAAELRGCGLARLPIPVEGSIKTVAAKAKNTFWIERVTQGGRDLLRVGGNVPLGADQRVYRAMSDPAMGAGLTLHEILREIGIKVRGEVRVRYEPLSGDSQVLAQTEGLALREQLGRMLRYSNNYVADLITLNLGAARLSRPPAQLADAAASLADYVATAPSGGKTPASDPPRLYSGSGLTPENQLSADDLIALLSQQYRRTETFPAFYGGLVVPRQAPFAFVRQGNADWLDRVALKTGTMNDPRSVCAIAGYLRKRNGGWMAFAVIINGGPNRARIPLYLAMEAARKDIQAVLAEH